MKYLELVETNHSENYSIHMTGVFIVNV